MKRVKPSDTKVESQMTPMIDVVFQLLTFFILTFKVVIPEGNLHVQMPVSTGPGSPPTDRIRIVLQSDPDGDLRGMLFEGEQLYTGDTAASFARLHQRVLTLAGHLGGPGTLVETPDVELDCDYNLRYEYVIQAMGEVTGHRDETGRTLKLFEKVKLASPKKQG